MKNAVIFTVLFLLIPVIIQAQTSDTLREGRNCKVVLYNGYQAEGTITERGSDTIKFKTDVIVLSIPVKDIKFVMNPEFELSDIEEIDTLDHNSEPIVVQKIDTTSECDIYFHNKKVLNNVQLIEESDSTVKVIRGDQSKIINIAAIRKIVFKTPAPFGKGYLIGSGIGFLIGFFPLAFTRGGGHPDIGGFGAGVIFGLICSVPAGLIGGIIGVLSASDDVYLFDNGIYPQKIKSIKHAMSKHY